LLQTGPADFVFLGNINSSRGAADMQAHIQNSAENQRDGAANPSGSPLDWRKYVKVHPAAKLFPLMKDADPTGFEALVKDIDVNGLQSPIVMSIDEGDGQLVDGRNRMDALARLGRLYLSGRKIWFHRHHCETWDIFTWQYVLDPYAFVLSANAHRRHLTAEQKRELVASVLKAKPEASNNSIAKQVKADDKTVAKVRRELESTSEIPKLEKTVGTDGKARKQPAARLKEVKSTKEQVKTATEWMLDFTEGEKSSIEEVSTRPDIEEAEELDLEALVERDMAIRDLTAECVANVSEIVKEAIDELHHRRADSGQTSWLFAVLHDTITELADKTRSSTDDPSASAERRKAEYAASELEGGG
jgi:hypothetical protein